MSAKKAVKKVAKKATKKAAKEPSKQPDAQPAKQPAPQPAAGPAPREAKKKFEETKTLPSYWSLEAHNFKYDTRYIQFFVDHLKQKKIVGIRCPSCRIVYCPPKPICGRCHERNMDWVEVSEYGTVVSFSAGYDKKKTEMREDIELKPVPIVAVKHDGADSAYIALLTPGIELDQVYVGMRVKTVWTENPIGALSDIKYYEPVKPL